MKTFIQKKLSLLKNKLTAIRANPIKVCMGYALGIFLATTPFIGLKVFIAIFLTYIFRWSKVAAIIGVFHINPLTGPLFYGLSYFIGNAVLGTGSGLPDASPFSMEGLMGLKTMSLGIFISLLTGGAILGFPMAFASYFYSYYLIAGRKRIKKAAAAVEESGEPVYTLITGASCGLGKELAIECAKEKMNLLLLALPGRNLDLLCNRLEKDFHIHAFPYEIDLTQREAVEGFASEVTGKFRINFLINNAGMGGSVPFETSRLDYLDQIIQLNIRSTVLLTRLLLPELKKHTRAYILNVSSMAAFSPLPFKTVYPASKAFILNFSRSLNQELKGTTVKVSTVHPGPMLTNPDVTSRILSQGSAGKAGLLMASEIARISLQAIRKGHEIIVPGFANKISRFLIRIVPYIVRMRLLCPIFRREISEIKPAVA